MDVNYRHLFVYYGGFGVDLAKLVLIVKFRISEFEGAFGRGGGSISFNILADHDQIAESVDGGCRTRRAIGLVQRPQHNLVSHSTNKLYTHNHLNHLTYTLTVS